MAGLTRRTSDTADATALARAASTLGYEIVDIAGFVDLIEAQAQGQRNALATLEKSVADIVQANGAVTSAADDLGTCVTRTSTDMARSTEMMRTLGSDSRRVASWVRDLSDRSDSVGTTLDAVKSNNSQIAAIAMQVNTLAINAKIEAARAGQSGKGFAVVAEAINELSQKTRAAAKEISSNIETLTEWISGLGSEARDVAQAADVVIDHSAETDQALGRMEAAVGATATQTDLITEQAQRVATATSAVMPKMEQIRTSITETSRGIEQTHQRIERLVDTSETMVQATALQGAMTEDAPFIVYVQDRAAAISQAFEDALNSGRIDLAALFDRTYQAIPNSAPAQFRTAYVDLLDLILPPLQEPALDFDPRVVFCACVDVNGYLPTHNRKFSHPQGQDEMWNTAHCRNRRIFDDRVGLKAGRNTDPFLLQVYRRDMGGGEFKMMKDLSAPIRVQGHHWGGVRLAYGF